jgi:hypothetical protein
MAREKQAPAADTAAELIQGSLLDLLDPTSRAQLATMARSTPPGLVLLWGPQADLVEAVATTLGGFWVPKAHRAIDLVVAVPDGRWTVAQVREQVLTAARVAPLQRRVIVVNAVGALDRIAFDMLLKTIEEPYPGTTFVFTCDNPMSLPRTFAGRVGAEVAVRALQGDARLALLVSNGWQQGVAERAVAAGVPAIWYAAINGKEELLEPFERLGAILAEQATPARRASHLVAIIDQLAKHGAGIFGSGDSAERAARRSVVTWLIARVQQQLNEALRSGADVSAVEAGMQAVGRAREQLSGNASLALVLTLLLVDMERLVGEHN